MTRNGHQREGRQHVDDRGNRRCSAEPSSTPRGCLLPSRSMPRTSTYGSLRNELTRMNV
jgi:hypothetical protein